MNPEKTTDQQPFWVDKELIPTFTPRSIRNFNRIIIIYFNVIMWLIAVGSILVIWLSTSSVIALVIIIAFLASITVGLIQRRRNKHTNDLTIAIQDRARELTGAELIGSAIHVAGHPSLEPNQAVVLAFVRDTLIFYPYDNAIVLDQINVRDIETLQTVVYDEDRIPHIDVIDPTAQALQLGINRQGNRWGCLFTRMRSVRAIEWYHAIQKAKVSHETA